MADGIQELTDEDVRRLEHPEEFADEQAASVSKSKSDSAAKGETSGAKSPE